MDSTPHKFDSDQALMENPRTRRSVYAYRNPSTFSRDFASAMVAMSQIQVLTGHQGEIRRHMSVVNHHWPGKVWKLVRIAAFCLLGEEGGVAVTSAVFGGALKWGVVMERFRMQRCLPLYFSRFGKLGFFEGSHDE
jgi:hypothetical protein